jgi:hypothetical protein
VLPIRQGRCVVEPTTQPAITSRKALLRALSQTAMILTAVGLLGAAYLTSHRHTMRHHAPSTGQAHMQGTGPHNAPEAPGRHG